MSTYLVIIIAGAALALVGYLVTLAKSHATATNNTLLQNAVNELSDAIYDAVHAAEQTIVRAAKADKDGKLTKEDAAKISSTVKDNVLASLSTSAFNVLQDAFEEKALDTKVLAGIERTVFQMP
jgi:hypothetical protein